MNRREFLKVFTFGVAAVSLPQTRVPAKTILVEMDGYSLSWRVSEVLHASV